MVTARPSQLNRKQRKELARRLRVEDPQFVKPQFQLKFDRTSPGRACKVAWKKGDVIGIKFV